MIREEWWTREEWRSYYDSEFCCFAPSNESFPGSGPSLKLIVRLRRV